MTQAAEYILSSYSFIATYSLEQILDVGYQSKEGNPIPSFDEKLLIELFPLKLINKLLFEKI